MMMSAELGELFAALAKAQLAMPIAKKSGVNPHFKSSYSTYADVWKAWAAAGPAQGLAIVSRVDAASIPPARLSLFTTLGHVSGQFVTEEYPIVPVKNDPQGWGSALTYARRYSLNTITGLADEDDDGNAATNVFALIELDDKGKVRVTKSELSPTDFAKALLSALDVIAAKKPASGLSGRTKGDAENHRREAKLLFTANAAARLELDPKISERLDAAYVKKLKAISAEGQ